MIVTRSLPIRKNTPNSFGTSPEIISNVIFLSVIEVTLNVGSTPVGNTYAPYSFTSYVLYTGKINLEVKVSPTLSAVSPLVFHSIPEASLNSNSTVVPTFIPSLPRTWTSELVSYDPSALNFIVFPEGGM